MPIQFLLSWLFFSFFIFNDSKFGEIFDEDFFIHALKNNVKVVRELPSDVLEQFDNNISSIVNLRVKAWSSPTYYLQKVLPKLRQMRYAVLLFLNYCCWHCHRGLFPKAPRKQRNYKLFDFKWYVDILLQLNSCVCLSFLNTITSDI
jgi:hypothetical protein